MLKLRFRKQFKKDYQTALKRQEHSEEQFRHILKYLIHEEPLPAKHRDHALTGNYIGFRECHIQSDWLLIYKIETDILTLTLTRTGSHSDLF